MKRFFAPTLYFLSGAFVLASALTILTALEGRFGLHGIFFMGDVEIFLILPPVALTAFFLVNLAMSRWTSWTARGLHDHWMACAGYYGTLLVCVVFFILDFADRNALQYGELMLVAWICALAIFTNALYVRYVGKKARQERGTDPVGKTRRYPALTAIFFCAVLAVIVMIVAHHPRSSMTRVATPNRPVRGLVAGTAIDTDTYREHAFGLKGDWDDSRHAQERLRSEGGMLVQDASATEDGRPMRRVPLKPEESEKGFVEAWIEDGHRYTLRGSALNPILGSTFSLFKDEILLLKTAMEYGAEGLVLDARMVGGKPAFTYQVRRMSGIGTDIFYDGIRFTKTYGVSDPRYLFSYAGKLGFIAKDVSGDRVFFDGAFITPLFSEIHTRNCCAIQEVLPTVYDDGILLFFARRDERRYLVEAKLKA